MPGEVSCPSCGHINRPDRRHCTACGTKLAAACPRCGFQSEPGEKFCGGCGTSLTPETVRSEPAPVTAATPSAFGGGRYHVRRFVGEGGKKRVYVAHDTRLERDVAIALVKTDGLDEAGLARVRREARAMGRLGDHPNIVTIFDVGEEGAQPFIVSQLMSGGSIEDLLAGSEKRRLPLDQVLRLADQICRALEHAHGRAIVHRDLKPANVWLTEDGVSKLGDFGLAIALDRSRITVEGMMVGTVAYMPPEQALGHVPDARSDLYALGTMLYEMVTGRPPFLGDDAVAIISQHINTPPVAPSWHNPEVPRALEALILRLLAKAPEDRPETAAAVRLSLGAITSAAAGREPATAPDANSLDRLASGVFVGREQEMDQLRAGLEEALSGRGRLLMLVGEPGIGKTRMAEELATYARLRKAQVLWGRCYEGEGAPAYWPWVQAIRSYVHDRDQQALRSEMGAGAVDIAQVVSELRERLPDLPAPPTLEPEQARFRLFDSVTTFLKSASRNQPLMLMLGELHWADKPSLLLLQFLARELRGARLLVVATYRDIDFGRQHPLAQTLGELNREQLSARILLRGLSRQDVARFIEVTAGLKPPEGLVKAVYEETEGNPFFLNEVVRLLVSEGRLQHPERTKSWSVSIPQSVREVVGRRLDRLSPECNRVLTVASMLGREFGSDALEQVCDLGGDRLLEVLDEALAARVIVEVPRVLDRYAFAHALIRETLYEELSTTRRVRLHHRIGEVLEALYRDRPEPHLAELAYHFAEAAQADDAAKAIDYAIRAGDRAAAMMAHEEACRHYEAALQVVESREPWAEGRRCELLLALCDALWSAGEYERAKEAALQAAEIARRLGGAEQLARAALGFGGRLLAFAAVIRDETLIGLLEEALAALGGGDSPLRASILGRLAEQVAISDSYERREALCEEAVAMARRMGDPGVLASVLRNAQWALLVPENAEERLARAYEIVRLAEEAHARTLMVEGRFLCVWNLIELGEIARARHEFDVASSLAAELRQPYLVWGAALTRVMFEQLEGHFADAEVLAQQALQLGQEAQNANATLVFGVHMLRVFYQRGRWDEMEPLLTTFAMTYERISQNIRCYRVLLDCHRDRLADARRELELLAPNDFVGLTRNLAWLFSIAHLAEAVAMLGDTRRAGILYALLAPFPGHNVTIGPVCAYGSVSRYLGLLAATMGKHAGARRHFEEALAMNARMGMRHEVARTQLDYAQMLLAGGDGAEVPRALALLNEALCTAHRLDLKPMVERGLALKLRAQGVGPSHGKTSIDAIAAAMVRSPREVHSHAAADGTVTLMFSDMEGFTEMTERLGDLEAHKIVRAHNRIVREELRHHGGVELNFQGDGFLLAFDDPGRALLCAVAIQRDLAAYTRAHPEQPIRVRIGLHRGEAIRDAEKFFGRTVILAARIASQAHGEEIVVSSPLRDAVGSLAGIHFGASRDVALKGFAGMHQLHLVEWPDASVSP